MPPYREDSLEARLGAAAERAVRQWYQDRRYYVLPVGLIRPEGGGAPLLAERLRALRAPDIIVARDGAAIWIEVKLKTVPTQYMKESPRWRHGIDLPAWYDYLDGERIAGMPGALAVVQVRPGPMAHPAPRLLVAAWSDLARAVAQTQTEPKPKFPRGAVYWYVDTFTDLGPIDLRCAPADLGVRPRVLHPWQTPGSEWKPGGGTGSNGNGGGQMGFGF